MLKGLISLILIIGTIAASLYARRLWQFKAREAQFDSIIIDKAKKYNVPPSLVKALIFRESSFRSHIRGSFKEYGLMQIRSVVADDWCRKKKRANFKHYGILLKPEINIEIGTWYLAKGYHKWRNNKERLELALAQYNAGPKRIYDWQPKKNDGLFYTRITIPSTRKYIRIILAQEKIYLQESKSSN